MIQAGRNIALKVPTRRREELECEAERLLAEFEETIGSNIEPAIPVEDIARYHLCLRLELADMHGVLDVPMMGDSPDILGALFLEHSAILIDSSLDPDANPAQLGRYRFSVGHEVGHWWLHRKVIEPTPVSRRSSADKASP
jgi:Zn-dependent peptidase ImmA (M78 family)